MVCCIVKRYSYLAFVVDGVSVWRPGPEVFSNNYVIDSLLLFCWTCDVGYVGCLCELLTGIIEIPNTVIYNELSGGG